MPNFMMEVIVGKRTIHFSLSIPIAYHSQMLTIAKNENLTVSAAYARAVNFFLESQKQEQQTRYISRGRPIDEPSQLTRGEALQILFP